MKTSIITITYNRAHLIGETIRSVLNQTVGDFEHIIIDDGSNDNTGEIVVAFNDPRIRYFKYPKSGKRSFLRNEGFRKAKGEYVAVLDSDDIWTEDKLEKIMAIFEQKPKTDFVFHNVSFFGNTGFNGSFYNLKTGFIKLLDPLLSNAILPFPVFTIRKNALDKIGLLDEDMIDGQHDFYLRAAANLNAYYLDATLVKMRKHGQNISARNDMSHYLDYLKALEKLQTDGKISHKKNKILKSRICNKMAFLYKQEQSFLFAKKLYRESFRSHYANIHGLKSIVNYLNLRLTH